MSAPFGGLMPRFLNFCSCCIGNTMASTNSSICLSRPPEWHYKTAGCTLESLPERI